MDIYELQQGGEVIGTVERWKDGLYERICCRCILSGEVMYRLVMHTEQEVRNLGVLVPMDGCFGLNTRIPAKYLGQGKMQFSLRPKHEVMGEQFIPISPEEPFVYLARLEEVYLARRNEEFGVMLPDKK